MNKSWESHTLADVVEVASGQVDPTEPPYSDMPHVGGDNIESDTGRLLHVSTAKELGLTSGKYLFGEEDVLYSKIRPALNKVVAPDFKGICSADIYPIRPQNGKLCREYLVYLLRSQDFLGYAAKHSSRTNIPKINREALLAYSALIPPLAEQRRIAAILDKTDAIRRKREEGIRLAEKLLRSTFLEMFGDPALNPNGWPMRTIGDLADVKTGATPSRDDSNNFGGAIPWVKTSEVNGDVITDTEEKLTQLGFDSARGELYPVGSLLVALYGQGATRGRTATLGIPATTNQACAVILPSNNYSTCFLWTYLRLSYDRLRDQGRGGNQPNLNLGMIRAFPVPLPPMPLQLNFERIANAIVEMSVARKKAASESESLFGSLVQRAFRGEL